MTDETQEVKATFMIPLATRKSEFQACLRAIYDGDATDEQVSFVLDNVLGIVCGHRPKTQALKATRYQYPHRRQ